MRLYNKWRGHSQNTKQSTDVQDVYLRLWDSLPGDSLPGGPQNQTPLILFLGRRKIRRPEKTGDPGI